MHHHWAFIAAAAYLVGLVIWIAGIWEERDQLREENRKLQRQVYERQPWRKASRRNLQ